jgi:5'-deoxynucleotidase YfbR-like HD superfamily hydrolase
LLHDASEAYLGDPHPGVKELVPELAALHKRVENRIFGRFGLKPISDEMRDLIKTVDLRLLKTEFRDLFPNSPDFWRQVTVCDEFEFNVVPIDWQRAKQEFLAFFNLLTA